MAGDKFTWSGGDVIPMPTMFPQLPPLQPDEDYRREWDGSDFFISQSTEMSLCLYCGAWYGWEEVHGQIAGGCYPPAGRST